jgi:hypothetical protein
MSDEQDVAAAGRVEQGRPETGATAVVPGQRTEAHPAAPPAEPAGEHVTQPGVPMVGPRGTAGPAGPAGPAGSDSQPVPPPVQQPADEPVPGHQPTTPVGARSRPRPRMPRPETMIRMGPWAPVAGAAVGLLLGLVVVAFLASAVETFDQRLALVFVVLGMALLGAGGTLLADEVRLLRRGTQAVEARSVNAGMIAGLLNGLTPARLLITASAFSLLLSAYVTSN